MLGKLIFNIYSFINGNEINKIYNEIKLKNDNLITYSNDEISKYLVGWGFNPIIDNNPLMEKKDIIRWCNKLNAYEKAFTFSYTGGSMGNPLKIPLSKRRKLFKAASIKYYFELSGYKIGNPYLMVKAKPRNQFLSKIRNELIIIPSDISNNNLHHLHQLILAKKIKYAVGFTSFFHDLAKYLLFNNKSIPSLECIVCASEALHPHQLTDIKKAFNCKVLSRYSNEEVGIIAHQRETDGKYIVDKAGVIVEVIDPLTLKPCLPGEEGNIIITDLNADLFPLIRYNTGDRAVVGEYKNNQIYSLTKILGREAEKIYNTQGNPISSLSIGPGIYKPLSMKGYNITFQFAQKQQKIYELRLKSKEDDVDEIVIKEINNNLLKILGNDAKVYFKIVDDLAKRKSGKIPIYINELNDLENV